MRIIKCIVWCVLVVMIVAIIGVSIYNNDNVNTIMHNFLNYLNLLVVPFGVILGILYGYPLLKQKITEGHIGKQFDLIQETNRMIRIECLNLKQKVNPNLTERDTPLTIEYLNTISNDIDHLNKLSIDASSDIHTYLNLLSKSIVALKKIIKDNVIEGDTYAMWYFNLFISHHLSYIQSIAGLIRPIPSNRDLKKMSIITDDLAPYVKNNIYYTIEGIEHSLDSSATSTSSVAFISHSRTVSPNCSYFYACYNAVNKVAPVVRCMYHDQIYAPAILALNMQDTGKLIDKVLFKVMRLSLIGYKLDKNVVTESTSCDLYYTSTSVLGLVNDENFIKTSEDAYINSPSFSQIEILNFKPLGQRVVMIKVSASDLEILFLQNRSILEDKMLAELNTTHA
ncbi:hypothetical protein [Butyricimonas paravirosa]|uniref:hypothetical protein n=1 Tax=Butyricimonas paravirosa TaxID=1472417 RepID=UPI0022E45AEB|nr:hypothetical protein [Butyricimonas paravirosa]